MKLINFLENDPFDINSIIKVFNNFNILYTKNSDLYKFYVNSKNFSFKKFLSNTIDYYLPILSKNLNPSIRQIVIKIIINKHKTEKVSKNLIKLLNTHLKDPRLRVRYYAKNTNIL